MKKFMKKIRWVAIPLVLGTGVWIWLVKFESEKPSIQGLPETATWGRELVVKADDRKSGLAEVKVEAVQAGQTVALFSAAFPAKTRAFEKTLPLRPLPPGLGEGEAVLRISAKDRSWNGGNTTVLEKKLIVDTRPPQVSVLGGPQYINRGGAGFVVVAANEDIPKSGINVGDAFFPGSPAGRNRALVYFALPFNAPSGTAFSASAEDIAGNQTRLPFHPNVKSKPFKSDTIALTDRFLGNVIPYFKSLDPGLQGTDVEIFLALNRKQRDLDYEQIKKICAESAPQPLWSGPFLRLPNSKPMAAYGERRTYSYRGKEIDRQIHLGVDLASTQQCPVPAANAGRVVFAGPLGIYGLTVILDHGCGLFSMYCHLSRTEVEVKKDLAKGDILGRSGSTGMAGGDHLHYAMLIRGVFVNPVEWWDAHWIRDNIELKLL
jgi:murein DD-endopeptidase MepM/ murein hydrolase activator NlpD